MRTTLNINDKLYKSLKVHAASNGVTISSLLEEAIKNQILEDLEDLEIVKKRQNEPTMNYNDFVKELKADGLL